MKKTGKERKIILELSEHEALQMLLLLKKQVNQSDKIWQPYWESQAQKVQQGIDRAAYRQPSTFPKNQTHHE